MPFLAPALGAAIGLGTVGQALLGVGLSVGMGFAARALEPKPSNQAAAGHRLQQRYDPNAPRDIAIGNAAVAGTPVYRNTYGAQEYVETALDLSDYTCDGLADFLVDGKAVTWNVVTGAVSEYPGMRIRFKAGTWDQTADAGLVAHAADGRWTNNHRGRGVCYVVVELKYDPKLYPSGEPRILFVLRGAKFYDWRKDSTVGGSGAHRWGTPSTYEHTRNPWVIAYNWLRGIYLNGQRVAGMNAPAGVLPLANWSAAANACDETVALKGGGTEPRYRADGVISTAAVHREVLRSLATAAAGKLVDTGGLLLPFSGVATAPVLPITDDNLLRDADVEITEKKSRADLVNAVFGTYHDPAQLYESTAAPPRISPDDETTDGARLERHYALDLVTSGTQAQRILEILRRKGRYQATAKVSLGASCIGLEAGDVISWTSARYGFASRLFEVVTTEVSDDCLSISVFLNETSNAIFAWTAGSDELDPLAPMTVPAGATPAASIDGLGVAYVLAAAGGGGQRPALMLTWTPPTDPSIVAIDAEYRRVGDTVALRVRIADLAAGATGFPVFGGIQGGTEYEVRLLPVTIPERNGLSWSGWTKPPSGTSGLQTVDVALLAEEVPPDTITPEKLSEFVRLALEMLTARADAQASVASNFERFDDDIAALSAAIADLKEREVRQGAFISRQEVIRQTDKESFTQQMTAVNASLGAANALIVQEQLARVAGDLAEASARTILQTTVNGNTESLSQLMSVSGGNKRYSLVMASGGKVQNAISMDGSATESSMAFATPQLNVYDPTVAGGTPLQMVTVQNVPGDGVQMVLNGTLIARAIKAGLVTVTDLSALTGAIKILTAWRIQSPDNTSFIDMSVPVIDFQFEDD